MREISQNILDIAHNSIVSGAKNICICIDAQSDSGVLAVTIEDDGCGMSRETLKRAADPFFTTRSTRRVGLGLSLLKEEAEATGGSFAISSEEGRGTRVSAKFMCRHCDCPPMGELSLTMAVIFQSNMGIDFTLVHLFDGQKFTLTSHDARDAHGNIKFADIVDFVRIYIDENISSLYGGAKV